MSTELNEICPVKAYQEQRHWIFQSDQSIKWFIRKNRSQLCEQGALLEIAGRHMVHPERFDAVVLRVGQQALDKKKPVQPASPRRSLHWQREISSQS